jgi:4-diphosphocytidyl-2-C-methyl-D-erythritol kinase
MARPACERAAAWKAALQMTLERKSPCKINLLLNILGKRPDGFHELETVMHPVGVWDQLEFKPRVGDGIELTCSDPALPTDSSNLVHRAAAGFFQKSKVPASIRIHLEKRIPLAAGLGGGSGNAANTLLGLNEMFGQPLTQIQLTEIGSALGSDVPFFLQSYPALGTGRGEQIIPLDFFSALRGVYVLLVYPRFGIPTAWAYQQLAKFPAALHGQRGRAEALISLLQRGPLESAASALFNSLEAPALHKYPLLALIQEFLRKNGATAALMSGSGSTTFALADGEDKAKSLTEQFRHEFGDSYWVAAVPL